MQDLGHAYGDRGLAGAGAPGERHVQRRWLRREADRFAQIDRSITRCAICWMRVLTGERPISSRSSFLEDLADVRRAIRIVQIERRGCCGGVLCAASAVDAGAAATAARIVRGDGLGGRRGDRRRGTAAAECEAASFHARCFRRGVANDARSRAFASRKRRAAALFERGGSSSRRCVLERVTKPLVLSNAFRAAGSTRTTASCSESDGRDRPDGRP